MSKYLAKSKDIKDGVSLYSLKFNIKVYLNNKLSIKLRKNVIIKEKYKNWPPKTISQDYLKAEREQYWRKIVFFITKEKGLF